MGIISFITSCVRYYSSAENIQNLSVEEFEKKIAELGSEQLIDVCYPREFAKHHIQGARNINFRSPDFRAQIDKLDRKQADIALLRTRRSQQIDGEYVSKNGF